MSRSVKISSWSNALATTTARRDFKDLNLADVGEYIPRGGGCSFGDAAFLTGGLTVGSAGIDQIQLDEERQICRCGAGVTLGELHRFLASEGLSFPVYGGTRWATVGGAIASDIHGKNHGAAGSFGNHLTEISVITARSGRVICSTGANPDLFAATVGGMGLTGFIREASLRVQPGPAKAIRQTRSVFTSYDEMFERLDPEHDFQYASVVVQETPLHGFHFRGNLVDEKPPEPGSYLDLPSLPRIPIVNDRTIRFAGKIARLAKKRPAPKNLNAAAFNYSGVHQSLRQWNRLLDRSGVIEYQYNLPGPEFRQSLDELATLAENHHVTMTHLVIKKLGNVEPVGVLSFAREGFTINFQVVNNGKNEKFLDELTNHLNRVDARFYLAKDSCLTARQYRESNVRLAEWQRIARRWDPDSRIKSDLAIRLDLKPWSHPL